MRGFCSLYEGQSTVSLKQCLRKDTEEIQNQQFLAFKLIINYFVLYSSHFIYELVDKIAHTASGDLLLGLRIRPMLKKCPF